MNTMVKVKNKLHHLGLNVGGLCGGMGADVVSELSPFLVEALLL